MVTRAQKVAKADEERNDLAAQVHKNLLKLGIETPGVTKQLHLKEAQQTIIRANMRDVMECLGLDMSDDSLSGTPGRVAKMYTQEIFYGLDYANFPAMTFVTNKMRYDELLHHTCTVKSMCEHHLVPFMGTATIGYIPNTKIVGLSKLNRIVDFFSRRPQVQERLTEQVSATLRQLLGTEDVAVIIKCHHYCIRLRGVQDQQSETTTSKVTGRFKSNSALRGEFLMLMR